MVIFKYDKDRIKNTKQLEKIVSRAALYFWSGWIFIIYSFLILTLKVFGANV